MIAPITTTATNGPMARLVPTKSRAYGFQSVVPDSPPHPSFCSAKYIQKEGITAIVMTEKNANANENTTAEVQVHSKFLTTGSARSFALTSTLGTFMRPPPLRPVLPRPRPGSCPNRMDSSPRTLSRLGPTRVCESVHKPSQLSQDRLADRNPGRRGTTAGRAVLPGAPSYTCRVTGVLADWIQDGLGSWWAPGLAFAAGVISFASPCVFPLVPGYLSFVAGGEVRDEKQP